MPFLILTLISCSGKQSMDLAKSKVSAECLLNTMETENFYNISQNYTLDFFQKITKKQWVEDLIKIRELNGKIINFTLIEANTEHAIGDKDFIILTYVVQYTKKKSFQKLTIVIENKEYKVAGHNIKLES